MSNQVKDLYEFGEFRLDLRRGLLLRENEPVAVPPKAFETLVALLRSDGRVMSKEELMAAVWPDTFVEENNLTQQVSLLRKLLGDGVIDTIPRRGYRFAAPLRQARKARELPLWLGAAAIVAIALAAWLVLRPPRQMPRSIAVLPFKPLVAGSGDDAFLEVGMADALITELSNVREIRVSPTSAVLPYAKAAQPADVGKKLGVEAVLDGRIQRAGDRIRVTAQLVRVDDGASLWAGKFDEELKNILAVQDAISARIVSTLMLELTGAERESLSKAATRNAEAYQLYLRGRYHWYRWTPEEWRKAESYFEQAVAKDPEFALAWAGLSDAIGVQTFHRPPREVTPRAKAAAQRAVELDESLAEAHASLGAIALFHDWDRKTAEREIFRAMELNSNHALSWDLHALLQASAGKFAEALASSRRARELDPASPYMNTDLGAIEYYRRNYDEAVHHVSKALTIDPHYVDGLRYLHAIEEQRKNHPAAIDAAAKMLALTGDAEISAAVRAAPDYASALRAWVTALAKKTTYVSPLDIAELHARLGDRAEALAWLEKALADRSPGLIWINVEPRWDAFRNEPRFKAVSARVVR